MSNLPGTPQALALVTSLQEAVRTFADREETLTKEFNVRTFTENRRHRDAAEAHHNKHQKILESREDFYAAEKERVRATYNARTEKIRTAHANAKRKLPKKIDRWKGLRVGKVQMEKYRADKEYQESLVSAEAAYQEAQQKLDATDVALTKLEKSAKGAFFGNLGFRKLIKPDPGFKLPPEEIDLAIFEKIESLRESAATQLAAMKPGVSTLFKSSDEVAAAIRQAGEFYNAANDGFPKVYEEHKKKLAADYEQRLENLSQDWGDADTAAASRLQSEKEKLTAQLPRAHEKHERIFNARFNHLVEAHPTEIAALKAEADAHFATIDASRLADETTRNEQHDAAWESLISDWKSTTDPIYAALADLREKLVITKPSFENWSPPESSADGATFGKLAVDVAELAGRLPEDERLALPGSATFDVPLALSLPESGSFLIESESSGAGSASDALNTVIYNFLATTPPGKLALTIIDPVGMGQGFAGLMHLADYEESIIGGRIWTAKEQIEEKLEELNGHMEKVIQMYLRNEYATITEYNRQAGNIAEKYHFLVVSDFPNGFSEPAAKRLLSIAASGARCGIYTLIHWDKRQSLPDGFDPEDLRQHAVCIVSNSDGLTVKGAPTEGTTLTIDAPLPDPAAIAFAHKVGKASTESNRVEVPFEHIAPTPDEYWKSDTTTELRVPIGRTGATKLQYLSLGKGTRQHALIAGKTGSGKSTLFHVMITNLALHCSPDEVEFYLIDFKKGVEFKCYASGRLPHAKVVAIESDREFGLSVLQRVDEELRRRGDWFRKLGAQDIAGYKKAGGTEPVPRSLLMIDEFQELFVEDDRIAQSASVLLDRIVRQGRAFGIHVILGSQTLGGAYSLARTTLGQMVVRIALQCNEADAYLIMDESNPAPRLLSRPGEGIYNDDAGSIQGNSPFQAVWINEDERDNHLAEIRVLAENSDRSYSEPIVFEGNSPADVRENPLLRKQFQAKPDATPNVARAWMGAPNSIKGPTEAAFRTQSGSNLLIVGQRDEAALAITGVSLISLAAQHPKGAARLILLDAAAPGTMEDDFLSHIARTIPTLERIKNHALPETMQSLADELKARDEGTEHPPIFFFIHDLAKYKKLRAEDDFSFSLDDDDTGASPAKQFEELITEGAAHGIHLIATVDTFNNVNRFMSRKALSEFEMRVVFQMGANDSASLIDTPDASTLGLHRALFYNEQEGTLETFRPYALPDSDWLDTAEASLAGEGTLSGDLHSPTSS